MLSEYSNEYANTLKHQIHFKGASRSYPFRSGICSHSIQLMLNEIIWTGWTIHREKDEANEKKQKQKRRNERPNERTNERTNKRIKRYANSRW